jgi:seryl-tRNA synthetase
MIKLIKRWLNPKRGYFEQMLEDATTVIWDLEFKKYTAMNEREVIRQQYDQAVDAVGRIKSLPKERQTKETKAELTAIRNRIKDLEKDMEAVEATIVGGPPTAELPNGAQGIDNKLLDWVNRRETIKGFIKYNC